MELDLTSPKKAFGKLAQGLAEAQAHPESELARDGVIQRFEYSYELVHKMLRRYLEATEPNAAEIQQLSYPGLVRLAWERGLLEDSWDRWIEYRKARGTTSHTYDKAKAEAVFSEIPRFLRDVLFLLQQLEERLAR